MDKNNASASARMQAKIMNQFMIDPSMGMPKLAKREANTKCEAGPAVEEKNDGVVGDDKYHDAVRTSFAPNNVTEPSLGAVVNKRLAELRVKTNSSKAADDFVPVTVNEQAAGIYKSPAPLVKHDDAEAKVPMLGTSITKAGAAGDPKMYKMDRAEATKPVTIAEALGEPDKVAHRPTAEVTNAKDFSAEQAAENEYDFIDESEVTENFEEIDESEAREKYVVVELTRARNVVARRGRGSSHSG